MKKWFGMIIFSICIILLGIVGMFFAENQKLEEDNNDNNNQTVIPSIYDMYNEEEMLFLNNLIGLPYYDESKIDRYLNYIEHETYSYEQIIRVVNTNNDLEYFVDAVEVNLEDDLLMLVNKYNKLPEDYAPTDLTTISTNYSYWGDLRSEANEAFLKMAKDASSEGLKIINTSPYRSYEHQNRLYNNYVKQDGVKEADTYSARPGYSEHQTGLALDVVTPSSTLNTFEKTAEFKWMKENSYKYGFILRYGEGMEYITGYMYEPWHYRYVGIEAAKEIYEKDLTFEEYYYYYVKPKN